MSLPLSPTMVELFFEAEKEDARGLLREKMDSCMDTIFGQMKRKLMQLVESGRGGYDTGHGLSELGYPTDRGQKLYESSNKIPSTSTNSHVQFSDFNASNQSGQNVLDNPQRQLHSSLNKSQSAGNDDFVQKENLTEHDQISNVHLNQPSTSSHLMPQHQNVHYSYQQPNDPIHCNGNSNQIRPFVQPIISTYAQVNNDEIPNESSGQVQHSSFLPATIVNEQSNLSSNNQNLNDADENGDVCECDDCLNGIEIEEEVDDDDDSDSVQWIEDVEGEQEFARPTKRPRMDSTQPDNATQPEIVSPREPTDEAQPNQVTKQFITVHLHCPLSECPDTFPEDQLTQHMFDVHSMGPFRCLVKDCAQAFDNQCILGKHIKQAHPHTTQLNCDKCPKHFAKYKQLSNHNIQYHQLGHYHCSFSSCTFTGEYRKKVFDHYAQQHKQHEFTCSQTGCNYSTDREVKLKAHKRAHLGVKPYRCKWLNCHFSSSYQHATLYHIQTHLTRSQSANQIDVVHSADPKDFLEVSSELLL